MSLDRRAAYVAVLSLGLVGCRIPASASELTVSPTAVVPVVTAEPTATPVRREQFRSRFHDAREAYFIAPRTPVAITLDETRQPLSIGPNACERQEPSPYILPATSSPYGSERYANEMRAAHQHISNRLAELGFDRILIQPLNLRTDHLKTVKQLDFYDRPYISEAKRITVAGVPLSIPAKRNIRLIIPPRALYAAVLLDKDRAVPSTKKDEEWSLILNPVREKILVCTEDQEIELRDPLIAFLYSRGTQAEGDQEIYAQVVRGARK